jgi:cell division protease FtsH
VLLAGRAAESLIFAEVSTGAGDDLAKATDIARSMVVRFGMDARLGQVTYEPEVAQFLEAPGSTDWRPRRYGEETADAIDTAVRKLIEGAYQRAVAILTPNRALLDRTAKDLLAQETFSAEDLRAIATQLTAVPDTPV